MVLFFTCFVTPFRIAFIKDDNTTWITINLIIDLCFFADIMIIFNSGYVNEDTCKLIFSRKLIACNYIKGWFLLDVIAILPINLFMESGSYNGLTRVSRLGRLYKLLKLARMLRILKIVESQNQIFKQIQTTYKFGIGVERLLFFGLLFVILIHVFSCMWVIIGNINKDGEDIATWIDDERLEGRSDMSTYLLSFYFTVTTITTVGFGDVSITTPYEMIFCIFTMLIGVIAFSLASGSLASIF